MGKVATMKAEKHWIDGGNLYVKVSSNDREHLVNGIRQFVSNFVTDPENQLAAWASAGVEKCECPVAFDPKNPDEDPMVICKEAAERGEVVEFHFTQVVRLTRGI